MNIEGIKKYCEDKSIIIVGNSTSILNKKLGDFIDSHDIVIRINHGFPRKQFVESTGKKTNIWTFCFWNVQIQKKEYSIFNPENCNKIKRA